MVGRFVYNTHVINYYTQLKRWSTESDHVPLSRNARCYSDLPAGIDRDLLPAVRKVLAMFSVLSYGDFDDFDELKNMTELSRLRSLNITEMLAKVITARVIAWPRPAPLLFVTRRAAGDEAVSRGVQFRGLLVELQTGELLWRVRVATHRVRSVPLVQLGLFRVQQTVSARVEDESKPTCRAGPD